MNKIVTVLLSITLLFSLEIAAQIPTGVLVRIVAAEDARRFDQTLEDLMKKPDAKIRARAALAAGRIGDDRAVEALGALLEKDADENVRTTAAFALGELESVKAADVLLVILDNLKEDEPVRARAVEAAGKIVAANAKDAKSKELSRAIVENLEFESGRRSMPALDVIRLGLTAVLRARPEKGAEAVARFLGYSDARLRADAANTLTRLRAKNAVERLREMLELDKDAVVRANAARALGAAEDKDALGALLKAARSDTDLRVRVSAIRAVGSLKDKSAAAPLLERGEYIFSSIKMSAGTRGKNAAEKNELLEIANVLGRLTANSGDRRTVLFLKSLRQLDGAQSPETEIALVRVAPKEYLEAIADGAENLFTEDWRTASAVFQALGEIANLEAGPENDVLKSATRILLVRLISGWLTMNPKAKNAAAAQLAVPDLLRAFAAFKSENTSGLMREIIDIEPDVFIRAAIAEILGDQPASKENVEALKKAFTYSLLRDKTYNDATLAIMDALFKLDKKEASGSLLVALSATDYLVRKKAFELLADKDLQTALPGLPTMLESSRAKKKDQLSTFALGSKLGVLLNTNADYVRAVSRKNGSVKAVLTTDKGAFTIEFAPEDAPLTVDNFIKLARAGYFNGLTVHRVVPNFVMQDGDPRGDGNGGPGWEIRCEINMLPYDRGAVGMALSGKDTGGSQWFVTHSPQPHLDGGYTVFGKVSETDMKVVDQIVRGDRILSVKIVESKTPSTTVKKKSKVK
ncbi:MAG: peptidylprolyl isomerase [Acidobacteria bacterium]|nr:peptidylprolyl isomerase [Acidobacteriota bacterium]